MRLRGGVELSIGKRFTQFAFEWKVENGKLKVFNVIQSLNDEESLTLPLQGGGCRIATGGGSSRRVLVQITPPEFLNSQNSLRNSTLLVQGGKQGVIFKSEANIRFSSPMGEARWGLSRKGDAHA